LRLRERRLLRRRVDPRQHRTRGHLVADLDVDLGQRPSELEVHVHASGRDQGPGPAHGRRHGPAVGRRGANRRRGRLREDRIARDQPDQQNGDEA
jgi:hypothetical protein